MRSRTIDDHAVLWQDAFTSHRITSSRQNGLSWLRVRESSATYVPRTFRFTSIPQGQFLSITIPPPAGSTTDKTLNGESDNQPNQINIEQVTVTPEEPEAPNVRWEWKTCGFWFGEAEQTDGASTLFVSIPYYSIVVPLTALSALLLLTRLRQSTPKKTVEPVSPKLD